MRLILVRHGHPDYENDCLTELGHEQAEKAAVRLLEEGIDEIFSSPYGRAYETAEHTAKKLSKPITVIDFMRELRWGTVDAPYKIGHPWNTADTAILLGYSLIDDEWTKLPPYSDNIVFDNLEEIAREGDGFLMTLGYQREGKSYRVIGDKTERTVAIFSHAGSSTALLSHLLNLPFFYLCGTLDPGFTAITCLRLSDKKNTLTVPEIEYANDSRHNKGDRTQFNPQ